MIYLRKMKNKSLKPKLKYKAKPNILDQPLKRQFKVKNNQLHLVPLAKPLKPTPYVPPKAEETPLPTPLPRFEKTEVKLRDSKVQKFIDEITPFSTPEAITEFKRKVRGSKKVSVPTPRTQVIEKRRH